MDAALNWALGGPPIPVDLGPDGVVGLRNPMYFAPLLPKAVNYAGHKLGFINSKYQPGHFEEGATYELGHFEEGSAYDWKSNKMMIGDREAKFTPRILVCINGTHA